MSTPTTSQHPGPPSPSPSPTLDVQANTTSTLTKKKKKPKKKAPKLFSPLSDRIPGAGLEGTSTNATEQIGARPKLPLPLQRVPNSGVASGPLSPQKEAVASFKLSQIVKASDLAPTPSSTSKVASIATPSTHSISSSAIKAPVKPPGPALPTSAFFKQRYPNIPRVPQFHSHFPLKLRPQPRPVPRAPAPRGRPTLTTSARSTSNSTYQTYQPPQLRPTHPDFTERKLQKEKEMHELEAERQRIITEEKRKLMEMFEKDGLPESEDSFYSTRTSMENLGGREVDTGTTVGQILTNNRGIESARIERAKSSSSLPPQNYSPFPHHHQGTTHPFSYSHSVSSHSPPQRQPLTSTPQPHPHEHRHPQSQTYPNPIPSDPSILAASALGLTFYPSLPHSTPPQVPQTNPHSTFNRIPRRMSRGAQIIDEYWGIVEVDDSDWSSQSTRTRGNSIVGPASPAGAGARSRAGTEGNNLMADIGFGIDFGGVTSGGGGSVTSGRRLSYVGLEGELARLPSPVAEEGRSPVGGDGGEVDGKGKGVERDDDVCTGCGTDPSPSFVALAPCDHLLCHHCINSLINSAAHKPPREMKCFACDEAVTSFNPAWEAISPKGLVQALREQLRAQSLERERRERETGGSSARKARSYKPAGGGSDEFTHLSPLGLKNIWGGSQSKEPPKEMYGNTNSRRDRSDSFSFSPLAMGSATRMRSASGNFLYRSLLKKESDGSVSKSPTNTRRNSVTFKATPPPSTSAHHDTHLQSHSTESPFLSTPPRHKASRDTSFHSNSRETTFDTPGFGGSSMEKSRELSPERKLDWSREMEMPQTPPDEHIDLAREVKGKGSMVLPSLSSFEDFKEIQQPTDWPVVRLDNIPWDITVAEVAQWLPPGALAPEDRCVLAVHILCSRADGRTLNQCYVEMANLQIARSIVRSKDGKALRRRPVHVTLSSQTELMSTIFPGWPSGFDGLKPRSATVNGPLLLQTELTGLINLCKLETMHAFKAPERPYYNIVTILQKFPWHCYEAYNSKQIVRLYHTVCAAVETLHIIRQFHDLPVWLDILCVMADAVVACPTFREFQKTKFLKKTGLQSTGAPHRPKVHGHSGFSFSPPSLRETFVTVGYGVVDNGSPSPSQTLDLAPHPPPSPTGSYRFFNTTSQVNLRPPQPITRAQSSPNLFSSHIAARATATIPNEPPRSRPLSYISDFPPYSSKDESSKKSRRRRRLSSISRQLGVETSLVAAIADELASDD